MRRLRQVTEAEAISDFLRNEFYEAEYNADREQFEKLVLQPDFHDPHENAIRRALLFRRRGHMWRELPNDTEWWLVEIEPSDLARIRVFPRAQWRKVSNGSFCIADVVQQIRANGRAAGDRVIAKIQQLRYRLLSGDLVPGTVLLIGIDDEQPLTILEGNHRLSAAMLVSPQHASTRFRVLCGYSARMQESCWYQTNPANLWRYFKNRLVNLYDREADVKSVLPKKQPAGGGLAGVAVNKLGETQS